MKSRFGLTVSMDIAMIERGSILASIFKAPDESLSFAKTSGRHRHVFSDRDGYIVAFRKAR